MLTFAPLLELEGHEEPVRKMRRVRGHRVHALDKQDGHDDDYHEQDSVMMVISETNLKDFYSHVGLHNDQKVMMMMMKVIIRLWMMFTMLK